MLNELIDRIDGLYQEVNETYNNGNHDSYEFYRIEFNKILKAVHSLGCCTSINMIQEVAPYDKGNFIPSAAGGILSALATKNMKYDVSSTEINKHGEIKYNIRRLKDCITKKKDKSEIDPTTKIQPTNKDILEHLFKKFHLISQQLLIRHNERETLKIGNEYDVQDLMHSLLWLFFDNINDEESVPSSAGSNSIIDFIMKDESIGIEIKSTTAASYTKKNSTKKMSEQLKIDIHSYKEHPQIEELYCFVYDPGYNIKNPIGFEKELSEQGENYSVYVYVYPKP